MIAINSALGTSFGIPKNGSSCTIHLIGPGNVGCAFLGLVHHTPHVVTGVTDSSGTIIDTKGLDCDLVISTKKTGDTIASIHGSRSLSLIDAIREVDADVVVDTTATGIARKMTNIDSKEMWGEVLNEVVVQRGKPLILAAKDTAASYLDRWSRPEWDGLIGINAVLGGTGLQLFESKNKLKEGWVNAAFAGSASTTTIIEVLEGGGTLEEGLAAAEERGFLEPDPELDLKGIDAGLKLSVVEAVLTGNSTELVEAQDLRHVDPEIIKQRASKGMTTRLVGRIQKNGVSTLNYEPIAKGGPLDVCCDEVVYTYQLIDGEVCIFNGEGVGAKPTAEAVLVDLKSISTNGNKEG